MRINFSGELIQNSKRCVLSSLVLRTLRDPFSFSCNYHLIWNKKSRDLFFLIKLRCRCYVKITDLMKSWALLTWFVMTILQWSAIVFSYCLQFFLSALIARVPLQQPHTPMLVLFTVFVETISSNLTFYFLLWLFVMN